MKWVLNWWRGRSDTILLAHYLALVSASQPANWLLALEAHIVMCFYICLSVEELARKVTFEFFFNLLFFFFENLKAVLLSINFYLFSNWTRRAFDALCTIKEKLTDPSRAVMKEKKTLVGIKPQADPDSIGGFTIISAL